MKILWVKNDFLHPTDRGGQIRTLETLRHLHRHHEIHYVAYNDPAQPEGLQRAGEYCTRAYPVNRPIPARNSLAFFGQLAVNLLSSLPLAVGRYHSREMREKIEELLSEQPFDSVVCDFLSVSPNIPDLSRCVLFQHNVETIIWQRHAEHASGLRQMYFRLQAKRMFECERQVCQSVAHVIAVSRKDSDQMKQLFGVKHVSEVSTGVDLDYFQRPSQTTREYDLAFVGAMDWLPNIDGIRYFTSEILPLIRQKRPGTSLVIAGRNPVPEIRAFAEDDPLIHVTGTVPDVRPYLWNSAVSIVPLRIGGGTRLKIYEAMAAGVPVVASTVGAEGLAVTHGTDICLADEPAVFAEYCLQLLAVPEKYSALSAAALRLVNEKFSWEQVGSHFERILETACAA